MSDSLKCVGVTKCSGYEIAQVKESLRRLVSMLGIGQGGSLTDFIKPGDKVVLKPNWIKEKHSKDPHAWDIVITHPSVVTAVIEMVLEALRGKGRIVIADAPQTDSSFATISRLVGIDTWKEMGIKQGVPVEVLDLREDEWTSRDGLIVGRRKLQGDPCGSTTVDMKDDSAFVGKPMPRLGYFGADYMSDETTWAHSEGRNIYKVSRSVIESNVFINLPKLKTHMKAGITVCMKNLVGINTYKNYLPHYSIGTPEQGGDEFDTHTSRTVAERAIMSRLRRLWSVFPQITKFFVPAKRMGRRIFGDSSEVVRGGSWYGNDTLWRTIIDLNRILLYANPDGTMRSGSIVMAKRYLSFVDGIISGEGRGPSSPDRIDTGVLIAGTNPLSVDCVAARMMGFDYLKIPYLREGFSIPKYSLADFVYEQLRLRSDYEPWDKPLGQVSDASVFSFKPAPSWVGHIELKHRRVL
jgi:uncharacterized protein (DUF362 family)